MPGNRKGEHLKIAAKNDVRFHRSTLWENVNLLHNAVPEIDFESINLSTEFLGKKLHAPLIIAGMTGGVPAAEKVNKQLASICQKYGIGFGVGSQRPALKEKNLARTYRVRDVAPDILLLANLGLVQFCKGYTVAEAKKAVEMIGADAIAIHLNAGQEAVQNEGDTTWSGGLKALEKIAAVLPVVAKETGCGIGRRTAQKLIDVGVKAIDVGGAGGTSWTAVESYRNTGIKHRASLTYWDWGIPTAASVMMASDLGVPVVSTGGMRTGLDVAKAIAAGAALAGFAMTAYAAQGRGAAALEEQIKSIIFELRTAMFLVGARNLAELATAEKVVTGELKDWI